MSHWRRLSCVALFMGGGITLTLAGWPWHGGILLVISLGAAVWYGENEK